MRYIVTLFGSWLAVLAVVAAPVVALAQETLVPRRHHEWGRFTKDSWRQVRIVTETLDEQGRVVSTSTTETDTTLADASDEAATLIVAITVEVAGKRFEKQPQSVKQTYGGAIPATTEAAVKSLGTEELTIDGVAIPCEVRQITIESEGTRWVSTVKYSDRVAPHVLWRETVFTDPTGKSANYETKVETVSIGMPARVLAETKTASIVKTTHKTARGSVVTVETRCEEVPGGVVEHASKEMDETGRIIRRSTLELLDYGLGNDQAARDHLGRPRLFQRGRKFGMPE